MQKLPHSRSLRKGRFSAANSIYLITMVTHERRKLFESFPLARLAINQLSRVDAEKSASTFAFVVMPDHIHWLCQLNGEVTLSRVVQKFKSAVTRELRLQATDAPRAVWQKGFHDHAIRKDEDIAAIARYVIENPVRAGLVSDVSDYSHWNCIWLL